MVNGQFSNSVSFLLVFCAALAFLLFESAQNDISTYLKPLC
jgi:hypothetical protein